MNKTTQIILGILALVLIIWGISSASDRESELAGEPIRIGFIGALTGVGASIGEEELKGAQLAVAEINERGGVLGRPLELVAEDVSLDKLRVGSSATRKLIDIDQVLAIVGPQWDEPASVVLPIIEEAKVPTVSPDVTPDLEAEQSFDYFFSTWYDNGVGIKELLKFASEQGWNDVAIVLPVGGGFYQYTRNLFVEFAPEYGINIIGEVDVGNPIETDFRTHLTKIKPLSPDAIFSVIADPTACPFMKQTKELGLDVPILSTEAAGNHIVLTSCPEALERLYFSTPRYGVNYENFESNFRDKFGRSPQFPAVVNSYDAVGVIVEALKKTNLEGGEVLRDAIAKTNNYKGVSLSNIYFDEKGFVNTPDDAFEIQTVKGGKFVPVE